MAPSCRAPQLEHSSELNLNKPQTRQEVVTVEEWCCHGNSERVVAVMTSGSQKAFVLMFISCINAFFHVEL